MSTLKTVGITTALLATGLLGYGIYKVMQDEEEGADEEEFDDAEDDVVYG